jgi:hypothetical protein
VHQIRFIKLYEREDVGMKVPSLEKNIESIFYHLFIQDKDGLKVFLLSIKEKPTYKKTLRIPKQGRTRPNKQGMYHTLALPFFTLRSIFYAKEELWTLKYFTMQKYHLPKIF